MSDVRYIVVAPSNGAKFYLSPEGTGAMLPERAERFETKEAAEAAARGAFEAWGIAWKVEPE